MAGALVMLRLGFVRWASVTGTPLLAVVLSMLWVAGFRELRRWDGAGYVTLGCAPGCWVCFGAVGGGAG